LVPVKKSMNSSELLHLLPQEEGGDPNCSPLSINCECHTLYPFYEVDERFLLGLLALPLIAFGLFANFTSILIFTHRVMSHSPINWYLAVLSSSDTIILLSAFFVLTLPRLGELLTIWTAVRIRSVYARGFFSIDLVQGN
jgi:hypothetical protein